MRPLLVREGGEQFAPMEDAIPKRISRDDGESVQRTKRVLFVTNTPIFGGAEKDLLEVVRRLDRSRIRPIILCVDADPFSSRIDRDQSVEIIKSEMPVRSTWDWFRLFRRIRPDAVVFIHGVISSFEGKAYMAARISRVRRVCALHQLIPPAVPPKVKGKSPGAIARRIGGWRTRHLLGVRLSSFLSDKTICVSRAVRDRLVRDYGHVPDKLVVIPNGVDVSE